ncbi:type II toxin-antitoxin system death-on-curing family toxin [Herbaspirillum frisingense]|uniref:type II toxin-antitoxin system death-on-curing family toxin n=1 Tax=Herbaspirillum frisingense TaxID=92645 RepID=UPI0015FF923F|nr:type II toxin-antitoxin system death-on-curing family toxin [Herbaspirillum frisingense]QNB07454.1 type II toxin-antitoxin system death-on-curing family toxin [Herbaspirillum frisingense]
MSWQWVQRETAFAVHDKQLAVHGGLAGIRDLNAVESALDRAQNRHTYGNPPPDVADLAAAYIYGIATSHGFSDGNKRTAWVLGRLFLMLNHQTLVFNQVDAINFMLSVAGGDMSEPQVADWIRQRLA